MQFADPQQLSTAYLILRHLYDGDIIEWPVADDHPRHAVFAALETQGYVARWDRTWPRRDRYRLTETGIAAIEAAYKPAGAGLVFEELRRRNLPPEDRRSYLRSLGYEPTLWALLHDPSTRWDSYDDDGGDYQDYIWEDVHPRRHGGSLGPTYDDNRDRGTVPPYVVDLDREANSSGDAVGVPQADYDVS